MTIQLPGYEPVFDNTVYIKDGKTVGEGDKQILLKCLILLQKYTKATEDQVVEYLQQKAGEAAGQSVTLVDGSMPHKSLLEKLLHGFPGEIKTGLRTGDEEYIKFVRSHTLAPALEDGESSGQYLRVKYGLLLAETITKNQEAGTIADASWYNAVFSLDPLKNAGLGERWRMRILLDNGTLPERAEMDLLLKHRTHGSKTLDISRIHYDPEEVKEVTEAIYTGLSKPEQITLVTDVSGEVLEELALQPVIALHNELMQEAAEQMQKAAKQEAVMQQFGLVLGGDGKGKMPN